MTSLPILPHGTSTLILVNLPRLASLDRHELGGSGSDLKRVELRNTGLGTVASDLFAHTPLLESLIISRNAGVPANVPNTISFEAAAIRQLIRLVELRLEGYDALLASDSTYSELLLAAPALQVLSLRGMADFGAHLSQHPDVLHALPWLEQLDLANTGLSTPPPYTFHALTMLRSLDLSRNEGVQQLPRELFERQTNLTHLVVESVSGATCRAVSAGIQGPLPGFTCKCGGDPALSNNFGTGCLEQCGLSPVLELASRSAQSRELEPVGIQAPPMPLSVASSSADRFIALGPCRTGGDQSLAKGPLENTTCDFACTHTLAAATLPTAVSRNYIQPSTDSGMLELHCRRGATWSASKPVLCPQDAFGACGGRAYLLLQLVASPDVVNISCYNADVPLQVPGLVLTAAGLSAYAAAAAVAAAADGDTEGQPRCELTCRYGASSSAAGRDATVVCLGGAWRTMRKDGSLWPVVQEGRLGAACPLTSGQEDIEEPSSSSGGISNAIIGVIVALSALALLVGAVVLLRYRRRQQQRRLFDPTLGNWTQLESQRAMLESELARANALLRDIDWGEGSARSGNHSAPTAQRAAGPSRNAPRGPLLLERSRLVMGEKLGQGNFGTVYRAVLQRSSGGDVEESSGMDEVVAVKELHSGAGLEEEARFLIECRLMAKLQHPNLVRLVGMCIDTTPFMLVLEHMAGGDLHSQLLHYRKVTSHSAGSGGKATSTASPGTQSAAVTREDITTVAIQLADAMAFLESRRVVHRDLACRNVLVGRHGLSLVKLSDYGLSRLLSTDQDYYRAMSQAQLPLRWMAPESIVDRVWTTRSDVWSFGIMIWEAAALGRVPYGAMGTPEVVQTVLAGQILERPELCSTELYALLKRCWNRAADRRPPFSTICQALASAKQHPGRVSAAPAAHLWTQGSPATRRLDVAGRGNVGSSGSNSPAAWAARSRGAAGSGTADQGYEYDREMHTAANRGSHAYEYTSNPGPMGSEAPKGARSHGYEYDKELSTAANHGGHTYLESAADSAARNHGYEFDSVETAVARPGSVTDDRNMAPQPPTAELGLGYSEAGFGLQAQNVGFVHERGRVAAGQRPRSSPRPLLFSLGSALQENGLELATEETMDDMNDEDEFRL
jgi:tRNA A-37 threonylcarbamoyl transferase component Bud32